MIGIGSMLHYLGGGSENSPEKYYGLIIEKAKIEEEELRIDFSNGVKISLWDNGQNCCESRYMTCDDNPNDLVGSKLVKIEVKEIQENDDEYCCHEVAFITIQSDKTSITLCTHNEHNGYYGGFGFTITERD